MSKRFDPNNLLEAEKLVTSRLRPVPPPKDKEVNICVRASASLAKKLRIAAAERGTSMKDIVLEALKAAGFE